MLAKKWKPLLKTNWPWKVIRRLSAIQTILWISSNRCFSIIQLWCQYMPARFSVSVLVTFWAGLFFDAGSCPVPCRVFSNISDLYLQGMLVALQSLVRITTNISRYWQMSFGCKIPSSWEPLYWRNGILMEEGRKKIFCNTRRFRGGQAWGSLGVGVNTLLLLMVHLYLSPRKPSSLCASQVARRHRYALKTKPLCAE